jgi:transcriptional regulator with XRE-family HTH domain
MSNEAPDPIDVHVGARVHDKRTEMGFTQKEMAAALGLTFQQIQKYERAANRISASKLYALARFLKVPVYYFFENFTGADTPGFAESVPPAYEADVMTQRDHQEMSRLFVRIRNPDARRQLMDLARTLAAPAHNPATD